MPAKLRHGPNLTNRRLTPVCERTLSQLQQMTILNNGQTIVFIFIFN